MAPRVQRTLGGANSLSRRGCSRSTAASRPPGTPSARRTRGAALEILDLQLLVLGCLRSATGSLRTATGSLRALRGAALENLREAATQRQGLARGCPLRDAWLTQTNGTQHSENASA